LAPIQSIFFGPVVEDDDDDDDDDEEEDDNNNDVVRGLLVVAAVAVAATITDLNADFCNENLLIRVIINRERESI
jgi:hypothetical protein